MKPKAEQTKKRTYKNNRNDSDSESSFYSDSESDSEYIYETVTDESSDYSERKRRNNRRRRRDYDDSSDSDESADTMASLHRTLHKLFPSKYMADKVRSDDRVRERSSKDDRVRERSSKDDRVRSDDRVREKDYRVRSDKDRRGRGRSDRKTEEKERSKKGQSLSPKHKSKPKDESEEEDFYIDSDEDEETVYEDIDESEESESESESEEEEYEEDGDEKQYQITLSIGGNQGLTRVASNTSCEDEYGSEDEKTFMKENYETIEKTPEPEVVLPEISKNKPKTNKKSKNDKDETASETVDIEDKYKEIIELKKVLLEKLRAKPKNTIIQKALKQCEHSIKKLIKHARSKNTKTYEDLLSNPDTQEYADEISFFKKKMSNKEQLRIMDDLKEVNNYMFVDKPYRLSLLQSNIPPKLKATALQKLNVLNQMEPGVDNEYYKLKNWVDTFMRIPFGVNKSLTITMADGIDKCSDFVVQAKNQLDACVYGLNDAKMQIMQMIGQWISNPKSLGTAIAIHGPPGTGKTSLIKDGISKILGREFAFIALGGCGDSSFLEGHSYTYEGSTWGKIVQILIESKCMNPVIYFDELDKISDTPRGQEIIGILTHLTDTSQNSQFHDKYFSEIDFDLSKCLFIFSYNDANLVNPVLRDRMYKIKTKGYDAKEKITIAKQHLLPKIREQVGFVEGDVIIPDDVLSHIINNQAKGEDGVRNLKRCLEVVHTKLNLYRLVKSNTGVFDKDMGLSVSFPYTVSKKDVDNLIKTEEGMSQSVLCSMYM